MAGVACTSSDGQRVAINARYVTAPDVGNPSPIVTFDLGVRLDLPALTGNYQWSFGSSGGGNASGSGCKKVAVP